MYLKIHCQDGNAGDHHDACAEMRHDIWPAERGGIATPHVVKDPLVRHHSSGRSSSLGPGMHHSSAAETCGIQLHTQSYKGVPYTQTSPTTVSIEVVNMLNSRCRLSALTATCDTVHSQQFSSKSRVSLAVTIDVTRTGEHEDQTIEATEGNTKSTISATKPLKPISSFETAFWPPCSSASA